MKARVGLLWDTPQIFSRFLEDCNLCCEVVTPHLLAAPFYRRRFSLLIVPTGFGNPAYSRLLPALRASSARIERYLERGGTMLVFGASVDRSDAYDWLPFHVTYHQNYGEHPVHFESEGYASLLQGYDTGSIACDGYFPEYEGSVLARDESGQALLIAGEVEEGLSLITTFHEYPSRAFMGQFCDEKKEILF
ncbi:MAG TPA: hypothetical protein VE134_01440 [Methanomicrobiales archaeon]|nr:hypothetical protein [Methanomicrobiales archaeon]